VKYVRCFTTGKRFGLDLSVFDDSDGARDTHQYFKDMRDKHVVHSVNPFEDASVGVVLRGDPRRRVSRGRAERGQDTDPAGTVTKPKHEDATVNVNRSSRRCEHS
jgi:hypothetical protein